MPHSAPKGTDSRHSRGDRSARRARPRGPGCARVTRDVGSRSPRPHGSPVCRTPRLPLPCDVAAHYFVFNMPRLLEDGLGDVAPPHSPSWEKPCCGDSWASVSPRGDRESHSRTQVISRAGPFSQKPPSKEAGSLRIKTVFSAGTGWEGIINRMFFSLSKFTTEAGLWEIIRFR